MKMYVDQKFVEIAKIVAATITISTNRGNQHYDDILSELLNLGYKLTLTFKSECAGARNPVSLECFLSTRLKRHGISLRRKLLAKKRNLTDELSQEKEKEIDLVCVREHLRDTTNIRDEVQSIMQELSEEERQLAVLLEDMIPERAKEILGWSHGKMHRCLVRLRKKFTSVKKSRTF